MQIIWNKRTKTIVWITVGVILLIILFLLLSSHKSKAQDIPKKINPPVPDGNDTVNKNQIPVPDQPIVKEDIFPLKYGKRGKEIEQLQMFLLREYGAKFPKHGIDGVWKNETEYNMQKHLKKDSVSKQFYMKTGMDKIKTSKFK